MSSTETTSEHSTASVSDVRGVIATDLDDDGIVEKLEDAWFEIQQANDLAAMDEIAIQQLEKYYAALLIRGFRDRGVQSGSRQSSQLKYDGSALAELRQKVRSRDPSGELADEPGVTRRTVGNFGSARPHSADGIGDSGPER